MSNNGVLPYLFLSLFIPTGAVCLLSCILWFLDIYGFQIFKEEVFDLLDSNHADVRLDYFVSAALK